MTRGAFSILAANVVPLSISTSSLSVTFAKGFEMHSNLVLQYLKKHGQRFDSEIAAATGLPLSQVRLSLSDLSERGEISKCSVTRYNNGKPVEVIQCRVSGYIPPSAPGRKPS